MRVISKEAEDSGSVLTEFSNKVEQLSMCGDIEGIFLFVNSKSRDNKSVFIIGQVDLHLLATLIVDQMENMKMGNLS